MRVLTGAGNQPLKGRVVANRAGRLYDSHFRQIIAGMVRRGVVRRSVTGNGYIVG